MDYPTWCCMCDDPFEDSEVPLMTFPITPCRGCDENMLKEVERCLSRGKPWTCPHRLRHQRRVQCTYCDSLVSLVASDIYGPPLLRTLAIRSILEFDPTGAAMSGIFSYEHPIWNTVLRERSWMRINLRQKKAQQVAFGEEITPRRTG